MIRPLFLALCLALPATRVAAQSEPTLAQVYELATRAILAFDQPGDRMLDRMASGKDLGWVVLPSPFPSDAQGDPWGWQVMVEEHDLSGADFPRIGMMRTVACDRRGIHSADVTAMIPPGDLATMMADGAVAVTTCEVTIPVSEDSQLDALADLFPRFHAEFQQVQDPGPPGNDSIGAGWIAPPSDPSVLPPNPPNVLTGMTPVAVGTTAIYRAHVVLNLPQRPEDRTYVHPFAILTLTAVYVPPGS